MKQFPIDSVTLRRNDCRLYTAYAAVTDSIWTALYIPKTALPTIPLHNLLTGRKNTGIAIWCSPTTISRKIALGDLRHRYNPVLPESRFHCGFPQKVSIRNTVVA